MVARLPRSTLFPYTTLFRSALALHEVRLQIGRAVERQPVPRRLVAGGRDLDELDDVGRVDLHLRRRLMNAARSEEHTSELQSPVHLVCRLLLEKTKKNISLH